MIVHLIKYHPDRICMLRALDCLRSMFKSTGKIKFL